MLDEFCENYKDMFSLDQGDTRHTKLLITASDPRHHPPLCKNHILCS